MKKILLCLCLLSASFLTTEAQTLADGGVKVSNLSVANNDGTLFISMDIDHSTLKLKSNHEVVFTPKLVTDNQTQDLPEVKIAGRNRYYLNIRNAKSKQVQKNLYRNKKKNVIEYQASVPFERWMERAELMIEDSRCGCLQEILTSNDELLTVLDFAPKNFIPTYVYLPPVLSRKDREVSGSAYIDFVVNRTTINENYRNNRVELQKIFATIDSVKNDPDATITHVSIKGYASPEGSYKGNEYLAKGRTEALMKHVQKLYKFPANLIQSDYEAEDWEGLRNYVVNSSISNKENILAIIDSDMEIDSKERKIRASYPTEYKELLRECYPALRHSDYEVEYTVRSYTDVEEAKRVMQTRPGNLSVYEFYQVANTYEAGSEAYNEVFDTMVRIYPNDEVANLNAANVAMSRGDMVSADKFLAKAGNTPHAAYARGVYEAMNKNFSAARSYFNTAQNGGIAEAAAALQQVSELEK